MVSDTLAVGVLTFIGTGLVTATGFWQWRRTQIREARENFRTQRVEALRKVWEALSDLEEEQRTSILGHAASVAAGSSRITQVNLLLLRNSPFLRPDEQEWAQSFAHHVMEIDTLVRAAVREGQPDVTWWASTELQPRESSIVAMAAQELVKLRAKLSGRYAAVVRGEHE